MEDKRSNSLAEMLETADGEDVAALERLETRIINMVEQLRESRRKLAASEEEGENLRGVISDRDKQIERLESEKEDLETSRSEVRKRVESLLDRLENVED